MEKSITLIGLRISSWQGFGLIWTQIMRIESDMIIVGRILGIWLLNMRVWGIKAWGVITLQGWRGFLGTDQVKNGG